MVSSAHLSEARPENELDEDDRGRKVIILFLTPST
jgi:hypothetical protein